MSVLVYFDKEMCAWKNRVGTKQWKVFKKMLEYFAMRLCQKESTLKGHRDAMESHIVSRAKKMRRTPKRFIRYVFRGKNTASTVMGRFRGRNN